MQLRAYVRLLLKEWWVILSSLLITVTATLVLTYAQVPVYETATTFIVSPSSSFKDLNSLLQGLDTLSRREGVSETYNRLSTSRTIVKAAAAELGLTEDDLERFTISSEVRSPANIIRITVQGDDPVLIADLADLIGAKTVEYARDLYEVYDLKPLDAAIVPEEPIKPNKSQNLMLATVVGLGLGVALAFVVEYLRVPVDAMTSLSIMDATTGVYNKAYFLQRLNQELSRASHHDYPLSIGLMNIERLDTFRGLYSTKSRNEVLRKVAVYLKQYLRAEDLIARFEGDKFAFLFPDTPGHEAKEMLEKLQTRIEWSAFELESTGIKLNLASSSGVMSYGGNGIDQEEMLSRAEQALQRAGTNGYSKVYLWEETRESQS